MPPHRGTGSASCLSQISYICTAGLGYDGPTGNGTISGTVVTGGPGIGGPGYVNGYSYVASQSGTSVAVNAGIYPNGLPTSYYWSYPGGQTAPVNVGSGPGVVTTSTNLTGLPVSGNDSFQLVVTNADGTVYGFPQSVAVSGGTPADRSGGHRRAAARWRGGYGQMLTTSVGQWNPAPGSLAYQWQLSTDDSSWTNIADATGLTHQVLAGELGDFLRAEVTATNADGSTTATSFQTAQVTTLLPSLTGTPVVTGTALNGQTLSASPGQWAPTPEEGFAYQWQRSVDGNAWTNIQGASAATYTLTNADVADIVRVQVTAFGNNGAGQPSNSVPTQAVISTPRNASVPTLSGTAQRLDTLTAVPGQWLFAPAPVYHYQWQRSADGTNWSNIAGATSATYPLAIADENDRIRVLLGVTNTHGTTTALSAATATVADNPSTPPANPTISGTAALGQPVTVVNAAFTPADVIVTYQWQRSAGATSWTDISGATAATYTPADADIGEFIRAEVEAQRRRFRSRGHRPGDHPAVGGQHPGAADRRRPGVRRHVDGRGGSWTGAGTLSEQWVRCPAANSTVTGSCQDVGSGTTYTPSDGDVGDRIAIVETDTNSSGAAVSDSPLSEIVAARPQRPAAQTPPAITTPVVIAAPTPSGEGDRVGVDQETDREAGCDRDAPRRSQRPVPER